MSKLFIESVRSSKRKRLSPTLFLVMRENEDGSRSQETVCIETQLDKFSALSFDDFSLAKCLKNGVSYKALNIQKDIRLGSDAVFDEFNERLESMANDLFVSKAESL